MTEYGENRQWAEEDHNETTSDFLMTVQQLGSGWAAVLMCTVTRSDGSTYPDVQDTGMGRYSTREEAVIEAKDWAKMEGIKTHEL